MKTNSQHKSKTPIMETLCSHIDVEPINVQIKSQIPSLIESLIESKTPTLPDTISLELTRTKQYPRTQQYKCYVIETNCTPAALVAWQNGTRKIAVSHKQHTIIIPAHIGDYLAIDIFHQSRHYTAIYQVTTHTTNHRCLTDYRKNTLTLNLKHYFNGYTFLPLPPRELSPLIHAIWQFTEGDKTNTYHIPPVS